MPKPCVLLLLAAAAHAQTVDGTVVNSLTGNGIAGVYVEVLQRNAPVHHATTDERGHFHFENVKDGSYSLHCSSPDYALPFGVAGGPLRQFQMTGGTPVNLEVRMTPFPHINGKVVDGHGEGVPNATVALIAATAFMSFRTDASGKFEQHRGLPPGAYTLSVTPPPTLKPPDKAPDDDRVLGWARTYYPGTVYQSAASKIALAPGADVSIELKLQAVPAHAVRGILLNPDGSRVPNVELTLGEGLPSPPALTATSKSDGAFEFPAVVDGEWTLAAKTGPDDAPLRATCWVEMTGRDIDGLKVELSAPFSVHSKIVVETPEGTPTPPLPGIRLNARNSHLSRGIGMLRGSYEAIPTADGDFVVRNVYRDFYSVAITRPLPGYYLDSIRVGEAEMSTAEMELLGPESITIRYKPGGGAVRGTAEKCSGGEVWLVPRLQALRQPGFLGRAICDTNDRYEVRNLRPGEYYVLAFARDSARPWYDPMVDDGFLNQAAGATLRDGETTSVDLRAITRP
jgi:hypothetical protein